MTGDFEPASSDIDFLAVTAQTTRQDESERLAQLHHNLASSFPWSRRLEGAYAARSQLRPQGIAGPVLVVDPRGGFRRDNASGFTAENMLAIREQGVALYGPPPQSVVPLVDRETFNAALRAYLVELAERASGIDAPPRQLSDWTLNITRCVFGLDTGRLSTKREAAEWLGVARPDLEPALSVALSVRQGQIGEEGVRLLLEGFKLLAAEIRALPKQNG